MKRLAIVTTVLAATMLVSGCTAITSFVDGVQRSQGVVKGEGQQQNVLDLDIGDCVNDATATEGEASNAPVTSVPTVDCSKPHDSEVYANTTLTGDDYPGEATLLANAGTLCTGGAFEKYIGADYDDATGLDYTDYYPTSESWESGDRSVTCEVFALDADGDAMRTAGSLKGLKGEIPVQG